MEWIAYIAVIGLAGAVLAFLLMRRRRPRTPFLDDPNHWGM